MRFILLLVAAVIAVVAGIAALQLSGKNAAPVEQAVNAAQQTNPSIATVDVLVARTAIPIGSVIDETMIDKQPWPENLLLEGFVVSGSKDASLVGKVARSAIQAREPFTLSKLANPNDPSFLAATLPAGHRAITIATDAVSGVAGYLFPGDRVDVLLTHNVPKDLKNQLSGNSFGTSDKPAITEVLVSNARILGINVREQAGKSSGSSLTPTSVTMEVEEEQVQKLRLGEKVGTLSLALRSLKDKDDSKVPMPTGLGDMSRIKLVAVGNDGPVRVVRGAGGSSSPMGGMPMMAPAMPMMPGAFSQAPGSMDGR